MKLLFSLLFCALLGTITQGQTNAITEHGDSVILMDNGRWELIENYRQQLATAAMPIAINPTAFKKPSKAQRVTKNMDGNYDHWFNEQEWKETDPELLNPIAEKAFIAEGKDAYGMIIYESLKIELEQLKEIAVDNAKRMGDNMEVIKEEYREVNGDKILAVELEGTVQGLEIGYVYYFANNDQGSLQFITFAGKNVFEDSKPLLYDLLNGLIMKNKTN